MFERMRVVGAAAGSAVDLQRAMGAFGLETDSIHEPGAAAQRRGSVAARLPRPEWPDRPMIVVAVNAHTGELVAFDRTSGVDLVDAVTASTALPGMAPTHRINGTHYINGGVRSSENADLAASYHNVVDHTGRRLARRDGYQPDESGNAHPVRPCRFRPGQARRDAADNPQPPLR